MEKNEQIKASLAETRRRRKTQTLKVYELKVNVHSTSKEDFAKFNSMFIQAKWVANDCIASEDLFHYNYKDHRKITNFDKDGNKVERTLDINTGIHQNIIRQIQQDVINLSKKKKKGGKVGKLKFKRQVNEINLRTGSVHVVNSKTVFHSRFSKIESLWFGTISRLP